MLIFYKKKFSCIILFVIERKLKSCNTWLNIIECEKNISFISYEYSPLHFYGRGIRGIFYRCSHKVKPIVLLSSSSIKYPCSSSNSVIIAQKKNFKNLFLLGIQIFKKKKKKKFNIYRHNWYICIYIPYQLLNSTKNRAIFYILARRHGQ